MNKLVVKHKHHYELVKVNREEVKRLREEREVNEKKLKSNNDEVARLSAIVNNPNSTDEEKNNAKKRIVLLEDDKKKLKQALARIDKELEEKNKTPIAPSKP